MRQLVQDLKVIQSGRPARSVSKSYDTKKTSKILNLFAKQKPKEKIKQDNNKPKKGAAAEHNKQITNQKFEQESKNVNSSTTALKKVRIREEHKDESAMTKKEAKAKEEVKAQEVTFQKEEKSPIEKNVMKKKKNEQKKYRRWRN